MACIVLLIMCLCYAFEIASTTSLTNYYDNSDDDETLSPTWPANTPSSRCPTNTYTLSPEILQKLKSTIQEILPVILKSYTNLSNILRLISIPKTKNNLRNSEYDFMPQRSRFYGFDRGRGEVLWNRMSKDDNDDVIHHRIISGDIAKPEEIPYQVALYNDDVFSCGSSLISHYFVLTAGHCLEQANVDSLWFKVGMHYLDKGGQVYKVAEYAVHEKYSAINTDYDIAILKSKTSVQFGPRVKPIALPSFYDPPISLGTVALASGWGATSTNDDSPSYYLRKVKLQITSRRRCRNRIMVTTSRITKRQICTVTVPNAGTCFGDSGGPLVSHQKLIGIVSWGSPCAIGDPDVYTNVQVFVPWIEEKMKLMSAVVPDISEYPLLPSSLSTNIYPLLNKAYYKQVRRDLLR